MLQRRQSRDEAESGGVMNQYKMITAEVYNAKYLIFTEGDYDTGGRSFDIVPCRTLEEALRSLHQFENH